MAKNISAGLLMYRLQPELQVFLVHPGGPFFRKKDKGWWTIPKGLPESGEELLEAACREFREETGIEPQPPYLSLQDCRQKGGKQVWAWSFQGKWDESAGLRSNTFALEWPPRSGRVQHFSEIDRAGWFTPSEAKEYILSAQAIFIDRLQQSLSV